VASTEIARLPSDVDFAEQDRWRGAEQEIAEEEANPKSPSFKTTRLRPPPLTTAGRGWRLGRERVIASLPYPLRETLWGLPGASSVMTTDPVRAAT